MKHHSIYLWERSSGTLVKILHGQKGETLLDVIWHPLRPIILSLSNSVNKEQVSIWAQPQVQNWSAFAPDFKELDENVEYEEKESEFDISDEDKIVESNQNKEDEEAIVDIETIEPVQNIMSSDEECEPHDILVYLSISPDVENPEENEPIQDENTAVGILSNSNNRNEFKREIPTETAAMKRARIDKVLNPINSPSVSGEDDEKSFHMDVDLPNAPIDDYHPMLGTKRLVSKTHSSRHPMDEDTNESLGHHMLHGSLANVAGHNPSGVGVSSSLKKSSTSRLNRDSRNKSRK